MKNVVLMYHDIVTTNDKSSGFQNTNAFSYKVEETAFEEQVKALQGREVVFTFDDGGESFITKAAPILEKYGKRGIFFISTKYLGSKGFLSRDQVKELYARGHQIGSHSHTHPSNLSSLKTADIFFEWNESVSVLRDILGKEVKIASIPNGYDSSDVICQAAQAGITELYTSTPTTHVKVRNSIALKGRYVVLSSTNTDSVLSIVKSNRKRFVMSMKWKVLGIIKGILGNKYDRVKSFMNHS